MATYRVCFVDPTHPSGRRIVGYPNAAAAHAACNAHNMTARAGDGAVYLGKRGWQVVDGHTSVLIATYNTRHEADRRALSENRQEMTQSRFLVIQQRLTSLA